MTSNTATEGTISSAPNNSFTNNFPLTTTDTAASTTSAALYPSITNKLTEVRYHLTRSTLPTPSTLTLTGTVKLHGVHADILIAPSPSNSISFHSRNRLLTLETDLNGFCASGTTHTADILSLREAYITRFCALNPSISRTEVVAQEVLIAGEWIGRGVQKHGGLGIAKLPLTFVIISARINGAWVRDSEFAGVEFERKEARIVHVSRGGMWKERVELADLEDVEARLSEISEAVAQKCPFAASFGIEGVGEGVVWKVDHDPNNTNLWLKTKGKAWAPKPVAPKETQGKDVIDAEEVAFAEKVAHQRRMEQGLEWMMDMGMDMKEKGNAKEFAGWVEGDVIKEERSEMERLGLKDRAVMRKVKSIAFVWHMAEVMK